ncbi:hypothetical protein BDD12DRAFT_825028 [Trichophaea hybrida]|nr:hypothetical protein BDD12DRAFT_825028 [Trichophaea hybrida]
MPHHTYSPIRTLAILLLLVFLPVVSSINVPPPLPEHEWVGKSHYNYTALHDHFAEVLVCLYIPVGVFGFYYWFIYLLVIAFSMIDAVPKRGEEPDKEIMGTIRRILSVIYSIFSLYQNVHTIRYCSHMTGFNAVNGPIIIILIGSCISAAGGILMLMVGWICGPGCAALASLLYFKAWSLHLIAGVVYFNSVVTSADMPTVVDQWDSVRLGAFFVALVPFIVVLIVSVGLCMTKKPKYWDTSFWGRLLEILGGIFFAEVGG